MNYRAGDYGSFRQALLRARSGENALAQWYPSAEGDLALQLLEWWAYLADILTFYNERALHQALLRTATPADVRRIVRLLGYRPRPGIAATGVVAAVANSARPFVLPQRFAIQAPASDGRRAQVFELDQDVEIGVLGRPLPPSARIPAPPVGGFEGTSASFAGAWTGYPARDPEGRLLNAVPAFIKEPPDLNVEAGKPFTVAASGVVTLIKPDDTVLLLKRGWTALEANLPGSHALGIVKTIEPTWDESGRAVTVITLNSGHTLDAAAVRDDYQLLKATKLSHLWLYHERYPGPKVPSTGGFIAQAVEQFFDPLGLFTGGISTEPPQDPRVLASSGALGPPQDIPLGRAHLEAITRGISPGDPVLFEQKTIPGGLGGLITDMVNNFASGIVNQLEELRLKTLLVRVETYAEEIWFANPPEFDRIGQGPPIGPPSGSLIKGGAGPIPIPHTKITFNDPTRIADIMAGPDDVSIGTVVMHYGWQEVGQLVEVPATADKTTEEDEQPPPEVPAPPEVPPGTPIPVLIEDATGAGVPGWLGMTNPEGGPTLAGPLRALVNLLPVSRGQTVEREMMGSGDAILINQEFVLKRAPLTYLADTGPRSVNGYRSTLRVWVNGIEWHEVQSFYKQQPDARVFVTREDDEQKTHVRFGDGELGARLPSGINNVVATYRYGSGADVPRIGTLTTILRPQGGLQAIRNPIAPGGGADPDPPDQIRRYAPRSVLTFGRAVSGDDYETLAAQTPGVSRARARWIWDANLQRTLVKVFVGDDDAAVAAARAALRAFADPNRPVRVELAAPRYVDLSFTLEVHRDYTPDRVSAEVRAALLDPRREPFGREVVQIDDVVYDSQIYDICMAVPGVAAVRGLAFGTMGQSTAAIKRKRLPPGYPAVADFWGHMPARETLQVQSGQRHSPGAGRFYLLREDSLHIATEFARNGH